MKIRRKEYARVIQRLSELEEIARARYEVVTLEGIKLQSVSLEQLYKLRANEPNDWFITGSIQINIFDPPPTGYEIFLIGKYRDNATDRDTSSGDAPTVDQPQAKRQERG
jgi:hypothetical protein